MSQIYKQTDHRGSCCDVSVVDVVVGGAGKGGGGIFEQKID